MNEGRISRCITIVCLCAGIASTSACAGSAHNASAAPSQSTPAESQESGGAIFELGMPSQSMMIAAEDELAQALGMGASCELVGSLRDRICALAQRICALSSESPEDETMRAQCEDGANRCLSATSNVRDRCGP